MALFPSTIKIHKRFILKAPVDGTNAFGSTYEDGKLFIEFDPVYATGTNWSPGPVTSSMAAAVKITDPYGIVVYKNVKFDSDEGEVIAADASLVDFYDKPGSGTKLTMNIDIPLDLADVIMQGNYLVEVRVEYYLDADEGEDFGTVTYSYLYNYCYKPITPEIEFEFDCEASRAISYDKTDYQEAEIIRAHTIYYPNGIVPSKSPVTVTGNTNVVHGLYTKTWTAKVVTEVKYTTNDTANGDWIIQDTVDTSVEKECSCDEALCEISCGIESIHKRYSYYLSTNLTLAEMERIKLEKVLAEFQLYKLMRNCGNATAAANHKQRIYEIGGFTENCGCGGDGPVAIVPSIFSPAATAVDNADATITVTSSIVDAVTTYHVKISSAYKTKIDALRNSIVNASATAGNITSVSSSTAGDGTVTYSILTIIANGSITTAMLANLAVTTAKIANNAVTLGKIETSMQLETIVVPVDFNTVEDLTQSIPAPCFYGYNVEAISVILRERNGAAGTSFQFSCNGLFVTPTNTITIPANQNAGYRADLIVSGNNICTPTTGGIVIAVTAGAIRGSASIYFSVRRNGAA